MGRRRHTPEQIITALREAEVAQPNPRPRKRSSHQLASSGCPNSRNLRWPQDYLRRWYHTGKHGKARPVTR